MSISKGTALRRVADYVGITQSEILAIGDGHNDIAMFEAAGLSVAMANAGEDVKRHATAITAHCDEDGVARAIERFVLRSA